MRDEDEAVVLGPERAKFAVESDGLGVVLGTDGVAGFDAQTAGGRGLEKDDGVVAGEFRGERGADGGEKMVRLAGPVGRAIHGAAVAEKNAVGVKRGLDVFEVALDVEDGPLGGMDGGGFVGAREAAGEEQRGGLGDDDDLLADLAAEEIGGGGLAAAGSAGEDDAAAGLGVRTPGVRVVLVLGLVTVAGAQDEEETRKDFLTRKQQSNHGWTRTNKDKIEASEILGSPSR